MRSIITKLSLGVLVIALPVAAGGIAWMSSTSTGLAPESMRDELSGAIVREWASSGAVRDSVSQGEWSQRMASVLQNADIVNLERAASAVDFNSMNKALMGNANSLAPSAHKIGQAGSDLVYTPLTPCRIVDTRIVGGPILANSSRGFVAFTSTDFTAQGGDASNCGIPENASALTVKITANHPTHHGYFTVFPSNEARPLASSLNYIANVDTSNESHFRLCRPACPTQFSVYSIFQSNLVIDVNGYFMEPEATALDCTVAQQSGNLNLLSGLQTRAVSCPAGYTATGGGCGGPLGIGVSNSQPMVTAGQPSGWSCDLVGSLLSVISYQVNATCCRIPGR
ncbi:MAG: hypothetical protein LCH70_10550 [Proteobacteria bacterium]|nr:hypothetical protein [Pseudomonadota bacterium]